MDGIKGEACSKVLKGVSLFNNNCTFLKLSFSVFGACVLLIHTISIGIFPISHEKDLVLLNLISTLLQVINLYV